MHNAAFPAVAWSKYQTALNLKTAKALGLGSGAWCRRCTSIMSTGKRRCRRFRVAPTKFLNKRAIASLSGGRRLPGQPPSKYASLQRAKRREMSKQAMREETERLVKEALERKTVTVKQGQTRIETKCGKCGAQNRVSAAPGQVRVPYTCKECGEKQKTL
jgi:hypothetical protein